ncbi:MAG: DUF4981 domain-containing protein [Lachnospiraceae bacterium]|nr:DUF4981 domain-containing protein [Lachnospiraceae bacterium]
MQKFSYEQVQNPAYFKDGAMRAHSDHVTYATWEEEARQQTSFRYSLDGLWKFSYAKNYRMAIPGFEKMDYDCHHWDEIRVPAHIQMEGYDKPAYINVQYPWDGREQIEPGQIPEEYNPVASYTKYFYVPEHMKGERIFISFQGVESGFALWLNGIYLGYSEDSFTPTEFELTSALTEGENKLSVQVFKWTAGSWCEDQDFYRFSGIFRSVYLYMVPKTHIYDVQVRTILDDAYENAELQLSMIAMGKGAARISLERSGMQIFTGEIGLDPVTDTSFIVKKPDLWSAETPNLYDLAVEIFDENGALTECFVQHVGFRRFELKDGVMKLNGKRIVFKGVNRHEFSSRTGRAIRKEEVLQDVLTMKQNNINAIRTSHYPDASMLYDLCDRYGLYMIAENNLETHGMWDPIARKIAPLEYSLPGDRMEWEPMLLDRVNSTYQRDKNHPAILLWSLGNESYSGKVLYDMSKRFRELDDTRLIHYEGVFQDRRYEEASDVESQMYPSVENIKAFLAKKRNKPFICCEYTHAMGNSCGAMYKYTDLTDTEELYQGGFIWDYIDQSIWKKDRYGEEFQAYGGDFGERPTDFNFSGNGIVYGGRRDASPKMASVKYNYQNIGIEISEDLKVTIRNKNLFINTAIYRSFVTVARNGEVLAKVEFATDVEPLETKEYVLPVRLPEMPGEYTYTVSFVLKQEEAWASAGHEVAFGQKVIRQGLAAGEVPGVPYYAPDVQCTRSANELIAGSDAPNRGKKIQTIKGKLNFGVKGENFDVLFSYVFGGMVSYRYGGVELIENAPKPNFWRAPTDNDLGNQMPQRYAQWKVASMYCTHKGYDGYAGVEPKIVEEEDHAAITYTYQLPTTPHAACQLTYDVYGDGTIRTTLHFDAVKGLGDMPEFGVLFQMNADYDHLTWYGLGPQETYADRTQGAKLGIYRELVSDGMAKYLMPQECGNKSGVRYAKVTNAIGRGLLFYGEEMNFSALPYSPHEVELAGHPYELPRVHHTYVRASLAQMGVAGDNSWGARTHEEFLLPKEEEMNFTFAFRGI